MHRVRRWWWALAVGIALGAGSLPAMASVEPAVAVYRWGWVTVRNTAVGMVTPSASDRGNSAGQRNTVRHYGNGKYLVMMRGIGSPAGNGSGGVPLVSAIGGTKLCSIDTWYGDGTNERIQLSCYTRAGVPAASKFSLSFVATDGGGTAKLGYVDVDGGSANTNYSYNAGGGSITVVHSGTGSYHVAFGGLNASSGNVQVSSAVGITFSPAGIPQNPNGPAVCNTLGWGMEGSDLGIDILCATPGGDLEDTVFTAVFTQGIGLKGNSHTNVAYLLANKPHAASYKPVGYRYSSAGKTPQITRTNVGHYTVTLGGMPAHGAAQVTAYSASARCILASVATTTPQKVRVACVDFDGHSADATFALSYEK
jgi:hypothetical protein